MSSWDLVRPTASELATHAPRSFRGRGIRESVQDTEFELGNHFRDTVDDLGLAQVDLHTFWRLHRRRSRVAHGKATNDSKRDWVRWSARRVRVGDLEPHAQGIDPFDVAACVNQRVCGEDEGMRRRRKLQQSAGGGVGDENFSIFFNFPRQLTGAPTNQRLAQIM